MQQRLVEYSYSVPPRAVTTTTYWPLHSPPARTWLPKQSTVLVSCKPQVVVRAPTPAARAWTAMPSVGAREPPRTFQSHLSSPTRITNGWGRSYEPSETTSTQATPLVAVVPPARSTQLLMATSEFQASLQRAARQQPICSADRGGTGASSSARLAKPTISAARPGSSPTSYSPSSRVALGGAAAAVSAVRRPMFRAVGDSRPAPPLPAPPPLADPQNLDPPHCGSSPPLIAACTHDA